MLDTKDHILAEIAARKTIVPSGTFVAGTEQPGKLTQLFVIEEVLSITDAILALATQSADVTSLRQGIEFTRTKFDTSVITASGEVQPGATRQRNANLAAALVPVIVDAAILIDAEFSSSSADEAELLESDTAGERGSEVFHEHVEAPGTLTIREFRPRYLAVLETMATALA